MGIENLHFLTDPEPDRDLQDLQEKVELSKMLTAAHRRGEHRGDRRRRDCPLCQLGH